MGVRSEGNAECVHVFRIGPSAFHTEVECLQAPGSVYILVQSGQLDAHGRLDLVHMRAVLVRGWAAKGGIKLLTSSRRDSKISHINLKHIFSSRI